jgi:hypothetical protein
LAEIAEVFNCSDTVASKALKKLKITCKKTTTYKEQDPEK